MATPRVPRNTTKRALKSTAATTVPATPRAAKSARTPRLKSITGTKVRKPRSKSVKAEIKKPIVTTTPVTKQSTRTRKAKVTVPSEPTDPVVQLPARVPLRLIERKIVFERLLAKEGILPARWIAVAGGVCFILTGASLFWSSSTLYRSFSSLALPATVVCTDASSCTNTSTEIIANPQPVPTITFVQSIPEVIVEDTPVAIMVDGALRARVIITSFETGHKTEVALEQFANSWRGTIPFETLGPGKHTLFAQVELPNKVLRSDRRYFYVRAASELESPVSNDDVVGGVNTTSTGGVGETETASANDPILPDATTTNDTITKQVTSNTTDNTNSIERAITSSVVDTTKIVVPPQIDESVNVVATTLEPEIKDATVPAATTSLEKIVGRQSDTGSEVLAVSVVSPSRTGAIRFDITFPKNLPFVEVYLRNKRSTTIEFAGLAKQYTVSEWRFFIEEGSLPPGEYELVARSRLSDGNRLESIPVEFRLVAKTPITTTVTPTLPPKTTVTSIREYVSVPDKSHEASVVDSQSGDDTNLAHNLPVKPEAINQVLRSYAAAQQSSDTILIESAERQLRQLEAEAIATLVSDGEGILKAEAVSEQFRVLKQRVETFERLRRDRESDAIATDGDGDGLSDYDETHLFITDPANPDTDGDGVWDGIEIVRGTDPSDANETAMIVYESPKEVIALTVPDVLSISAVTPIISQPTATDDRTPEPPIIAQITGQALPNSFVTLYIFSTPTIVTVKTDADGSFVYTFEKELQDGSHDVYVAITDHTGSIVARSNPFRFIKEAQAFTPVDAAADVVVTSTPLPELQAQNAYSMVAGIGVLALGIILLMLGLGLRTPENDVPLIEQQRA